MSRLVLGVLAEYVNYLADGKPVVVGMFDGFNVGVLSDFMPAAVPPHWLFMRVGFQPHEGLEHQFGLRLRDEDGREILAVGPIPVKLNLGRIEGFEQAHNWANHFGDLTVPKCGTYHWEVLLNGDLRGEVPFHVTRAGAPTPEQTYRKLG